MVAGLYPINRTLEYALARLNIKRFAPMLPIPDENVIYPTERPVPEGLAALDYLIFDQRVEWSKSMARFIWICTLPCITITNAQAL